MSLPPNIFDWEKTYEIASNTYCGNLECFIDDYFSYRERGFRQQKNKRLAPSLRRMR